MMDVSELCYAFVEDVSKRMKQKDIQYLLGLKKFFIIYLDTVSSTEPELSATPKLSILTLQQKNDKRLQLAGCRRIYIQSTAISRRRDGIPRGSKMFSSGRPVNGFTQT